MLTFLGAEIVLTPASEGMKGAIATAEVLLRTRAGAQRRDSRRRLRWRGDCCGAADWPETGKRGQDHSGGGAVVLGTLSIHRAV